MINSIAPRVVVLGGGYAGVELVESLEDAPVDVVLVDQKPEHTRKTKLWKMAVGRESDAVEPLSKVARKAGAELRLGQVQAIDTEARQVKLEGGPSLSYDYLVVALGSRPATPEGAEHVLTIDQPEDAQHIRETVRARALEALQTGQSLPIVVVGGGATGIELAGVAHEVVRQVSPQLLERLELTLVHSQNRILNGQSDELAARTTAALADLGVRLQLGQRVAAVREGQVELASGQTLPSVCTLWATGTRAPELLASLGPTDRAGRLEVSEHLNLPDHPEVFIIGDAALARCAGQSVPPNKRAAKQEAEQTAQNLRNAVAGKPLEPFTFRDNKDWHHIGPVKL